MDEAGPISRREALSGLGVIASVSVALVGVIVYRIVDGAPARGPHPAPPLWAAAVDGASAEPLDGNGTSPALAEWPADPSADSALASAAPIPTEDEGGDGVSAASTTSITPTADALPTEAASPAPLEGFSAPVQAPRFVAPGGSPRPAD